MSIELRKRIGVGVGIVAIAAMGGLVACSGEPSKGPSSSEVKPTEKNLSPTGPNVFAPGSPVTTTTWVNGTNNNTAPRPPAPPGGSPAHGNGRGAAGPGGPGGGGPGGGGPGGGGGGGR